MRVPQTMFDHIYLRVDSTEQTLSSPGMMQPLVPVFVLAFAILFKLEQGSFLKYLSLCVTVVGASLMVVGNILLREKRTAGTSVNFGILLFPLAFIFYALFIILLKKSVVSLSPETSTLWLRACMFFPSIILSGFFFDRVLWSTLPIIIWLGFVGCGIFGAVATIFLGHSQKYIPPSEAGLTVPLQTIIVVVGSAIFFGDRPSWLEFVGGAICIAALFMSVWARYQEASVQTIPVVLEIAVQPSKVSDDNQDGNM